MKDTPWLTKKAWATNELTSDVRKEAWWLLSIGLALLAMAGSALHEIADEWRQGNYLIVLVLIFPVSGFVLLTLSFQRWLQWWRFGKSLLVLDPFPASIGGQCGGCIHLKMPYDKNQAFSLKLECTYSYVTRSGNKSTRKQETRWYQEGFGDSQYAQNNNTDVRFCFDLPDDLPPTELNKRDHHLWTLRVSTEHKGRPFERVYRLPVFRTNRATSIYRRSLATEHPANAERVTKRLSQLDIDDDGQTVLIQHHYGRRLLERIGIMLFGSVFVGSGIGLYLVGAPIIFPIMFTPIGAAFVVFAVYALTNHYVVNLSTKSLITHRRILGLFGQQQEIPTSQIKRLEVSPASVWRGQQGNQKYYYTIKAVLTSGKSVVLVEMAEGKVAAESLKDKLATRLDKR
jgi:hypothetical protein